MNENSSCPGGGPDSVHAALKASLWTLVNGCMQESACMRMCVLRKADSSAQKQSGIVPETADITVPPTPHLNTSQQLSNNRPA